MNKYVKEYLHRGLVFGGFGPIILGVVYAILESTIDGFSLGGGEVLVGIISTYLIAFVQAGGSVFNQIEGWPLAKSLLLHFTTIYAAYLGAYVINSWIPFEWAVVGIFTGVFVVTYLVVWLVVYLSVRAASAKMNKKIS